MSLSSQPKLQLFNNQDRVKLVFDLDVYTFDHGGRPLTVTRRDGIYRRGLDGRTLCIQRYLKGEDKFHSVRTLSSGQREVFLEEVRERLLEAQRRLGDEFTPLAPALNINLAQDALCFRHLMGEVGILPPDCYRALVLSLTQGCSYNQCSFCHFFKGKEFRVRGPSEFAHHIEKVRQAFGPALGYRQGIFLGQANAANLETERLKEALESIRRAFPGELKDPTGRRRHPQGFDHVSSFMDTFSQLGRTRDDWQLLFDLGLRSLYLGVESGSPEVLRLLRKPGHPRWIEEQVRMLKEIGLGINVIFMTGVGGEEMAHIHEQGTVELLRALPLTTGDRIYFSDFAIEPNSDYARQARALGLTAMDRQQCRHQTRRIKSQLCFLSPPRGPAVTLYDVRQFVY